MWPFDRKPRAQAGGGLSATEIALEALQREARGARAVDSAALALSQACIGLWERAIASASIAGGMAIDPVTPPVLALTGRMLATRGNALFVIEAVPGSGIRLHPVSSWDPRGGYRPESRRYYVTLSGPNGTISYNVHGDSVLHFKTGASDAEWWRGRGPLYRASGTAALAARLEKQMQDEAKIPVSRIVPFSTKTPIQTEAAEGADLDNPTVEAIKRGGIAIVQGPPAGGGFDQTPAARFAPQRMGAHPAETVPTLRSDVGQEICAAFGVPPAVLISGTGTDGAAQRESWRRFWLGTVAPLGRMIQGELRAKLDTGAMVTFEALAAADEDGRSRAISRRAAAAKVFTDMGFERDRALALAGIEA